MNMGKKIILKIKRYKKIVNAKFTVGQLDSKLGLLLHRQQGRHWAVAQL